MRKKDISKTIMKIPGVSHSAHCDLGSHGLQIYELPAPLLILELDDQISICYPGYVRKRMTDCCHKLAFTFGYEIIVP